MREKIVFIFLILCITAIPQDYSFERITSEDGLSQNNVISIFQDSDGYMWFGTYDGLNRYDGYEFKVYRVTGDKNSLTSNLIQTVIEDKTGNIWVATFDNGVCKLNKSTEEFKQYQNTPENPNLITNNSLYSITCDSKNNVWLATRGGLTCISQLPDGSEKILQYKHDPNNKESLYHPELFNVYEDKKGRIWVGTQTSLDLMLFNNSGEMQNKFLHFLTNERIESVHDIVEVPEGLIINHFAGVILFKFNEISPLKSEYVFLEKHLSLRFAYDNMGNLWSGGANGLYLFKRAPGENVPYVMSRRFIEGDGPEFLSNQFIRSIYIDRNGILWLGTNGGGILKYNAQRIKFRTYKNTKEPGSISNSKIWTFFEDKKNNLWIGTEGGGINLHSRKNSSNYHNGFVSFDVCPPGEQNFVFDIIDISIGSELRHFIIGSGYDTKIADFKKVNNHWEVTPILTDMIYQVMALHKDEFNTVWAGSYQGGLMKYYPHKTGKNNIQYLPKNSSIKTDIIRSFFEDSRGRLWIGTNNGLMLLTREQKINDSLEFTLFSHIPEDPTSISHNYIVPIIETSTGEIWIGTFGGGINRYIEGNALNNGTFTTLDMSDGLPNNTIKCIIEDDYGNLWITSNKGLTRYDPIRKNIRNFTPDDGLQDLEFIDLAGIKRHDGEILIGGVKGFNAFYPGDITQDTVPPKLVFNELKINNQQVSVDQEIDGKTILTKTINETDEIILKHTHNNFSIHFAAIQYTAPEGNRFMYKLDGFDKDWISVSTDSRFANYTNIEAGKYTFMLKGSNSDGVWTRSPKELTIKIKPPLWLNSWFQLTFILVVAIITSSLLWFRFYLIKSRNTALEQEVEKRTHELRHSNKLLADQSKELEIQKKNLEESNATKDKFYSILSHDLKGPFNALLGYLELLSSRINSYNNEKRVEKIKRAYDSAQILFQFMQNILQWSRAQRGLIPFIPVKVNIYNEINNVLSIYSGVASVKNIQVSANIYDKEATAVVDQNMFKTIMRNLISNAIKYTYPEGTIKINVSKSNNSILFSVSDKGVGIPEEVVKKLFLIENKYSTEGTNNEKGTGLGLILCKEFIDKHNGKIWIESKEGEGTTVSFTIPIIL